MHERFGSSMVVDVLRGSKSSRIRELGFDNLSTYGIMANYSKDDLKNLISYLVTEGYIKLVGDKYPVLMLTDASNYVLFKNKQVVTKKKIQKNDIITIEEDNSKYKVDEKLFNVLRALRRKLAEEANVPPFVIFSDASLRQMSTFYPTTEEKMLNIEGVGINKLSKYGNIFIKTIKNYITENNISVIPEQKAKKRSSEKMPKEDTKIISYNLYVSGKSIDEIANERGLSKNTIESHLLACLENGMELDLEKEIHLQFKDKIENTIKTLGIEKLRPIKDALGDEISYLDIKYYIYKLKLSGEI